MPKEPITSINFTSVSKDGGVFWQLTIVRGTEDGRAIRGKASPRLPGESDEAFNARANFSAMHDAAIHLQSHILKDFWENEMNEGRVSAEQPKKE